MVRSDGARADADTVVMPRLNNLETRPQERSSLGTVSPTDRAQCIYIYMRMSSIDMGLVIDYDSTVMLTRKLLFATAEALVDIGPDMLRQS